MFHIEPGSTASLIRGLLIFAVVWVGIALVFFYPSTAERLRKQDQAPQPTKPSTEA